MAIKLLGFTFGKKVVEPEKHASFVPPAEDDKDGSITLEAGTGIVGHYIDLEGAAKNENDLINKYRKVSIVTELDMAINDIINEAIVIENNKPPVSINLDDLDVSVAIKEKIITEFKEIIRLLNFNSRAHDIFKRWYVDGRLYFHKVIDEKKPKLGIQELRPIDPRAIKKLKQIVKKKDPETRADIIIAVVDYYIFKPSQQRQSATSRSVAGGSALSVEEGVQIAKDSITYVHSGVSDDTGLILSNLHKALKPLNNLTMIEDAVVIYRVSRSAERRIFYIDVGNLPKIKAEQYLKSVMTRYRNKFVYDANTGEIRDGHRFQSMQEDFWLPRREGGKGTEISTLPAGANLGELEDIKYFRKKLFRSLHIPESRIEQDGGGGGFQLGKNAEINRDELKFTKFIKRLRNRFNHLFQDLIKTQLILKGIITKEDWELFKEHINYDYIMDAHFAELKNSEVLRDRLDTLNVADPYIGKYYSNEWVRRNILHQTEEEIKVINDQIDSENKQVDDNDEGDFPEA